MVTGNVETVVEERVATVWLNRPEKQNAFDAAMIIELTETFARLSSDTAIGVVVLAGKGESFCAGADLHWMDQMGRAEAEVNLRDAKATAEMFQTIFKCSRPVVARIHGAVFGGGLGLVAAADIAIAATTAIFSASEVRLGLIPALISPYVVRAINPRAAGSYFLTGDRFDARTAKFMGLVHETCPPETLDATVVRITNSLLQGAPQAQTSIKALLRDLAPVPDANTAGRLARTRSGAEASEGVNAFLEKRLPRWRR